MKINSKKILFASLAVVGLAVAVSSCKKDLNINVPMKMADITFTIPVSEVSGPYTQEKEVATSIDSILGANKVKKDNIKSIKLETLKLTILNGDSVNNFGILQSIKGEFAKDGGSYVTVSELSSNPDSVVYELSMPVNTSTEFKDYLSGTVFKFKISGATRRPVTSPMTVKAALKFNMEAGL